MNKNPMPKVGDIINPIREQEQIAWWHKKSEPSGKFCRIIWNKQKEKHLAVCNHNFSSGIIAFVVGKLPQINDLLEVMWSNDRTCKVKAVPRYKEDIDKILKEYEDGDKAIEDIIYDYITDNIVSDDDSDDDVLKVYAHFMLGTASLLKTTER